MYAHNFCHFKVESFTCAKVFEVRQTYTVITGVRVFKNTAIFRFRYKSEKNLWCSCTLQSNRARQTLEHGYAISHIIRHEVDFELLSVRFKDRINDIQNPGI